MIVDLIFELKCFMEDEEIQRFCIAPPTDSAKLSQDIDLSDAVKNHQRELCFMFGVPTSTSETVLKKRLTHELEKLVNNLHVIPKRMQLYKQSSYKRTHVPLCEYNLSEEEIKLVHSAKQAVGKLNKRLITIENAARTASASELMKFKTQVKELNKQLVEAQMTILSYNVPV